MVKTRNFTSKSSVTTPSPSTLTICQGKLLKIIRFCQREKGHFAVAVAYDLARLVVQRQLVEPCKSSAETLGETGVWPFILAQGGGTPRNSGVLMEFVLLMVGHRPK